MVSDLMSDAAHAAVSEVVAFPSRDVNYALHQLATAYSGSAASGDDGRKRACLLAIRAVVDSELGAPSPADLRAEAEAAVARVVADCRERRRDVAADMIEHGLSSGDSLLFERLGHALNDALVYERKEAQRDALAAIEAVARWRRAEMEET